MKKLLFVALSTSLLFSCNQSNSIEDKEVVSAIAAGGEEDEAMLAKHAAEIEKEAKELEEIQNSITTLKFDKETHDFGEVMMGSENKCVFKVTNTGNKPLLISNVSASCGCTTPKKPDGPIAPGKSDVIEVGFKPNNQGLVEKTVTVEANTEPKVQTVKVKATVK